MQQIYHKKNEQVEFYKDKECTEAFDFTVKTYTKTVPVAGSAFEKDYTRKITLNKKQDLYIQLINGELTPLMYAIDKAPYGTTIYCSYVNNDILANCFLLRTPLKIVAWKKDITIVTLDDITPNLSKYIPEDNAVLFLSEECYVDNHEIFCHRPRKFLLNTDYESLRWLFPQKYTIFLPHGTQSELQKVNEVAKELKEKYGVEEVNLFVLHWFIPKKLFIKTLRPSKVDRMYDNEIYGYEMQKICKHINKIITTNSTGILKPEDSNERLQVIDCKEIFEEHLKESN